MESSNIFQLPEGVELAQRAEKVFKASNAVMQASICCPCPKEQNCFECGNAECFEAMGAQAEVYGMTFDEYINAIMKMQAEDVERVKEQKARFERYYRHTENARNIKTVRKIIQKENGLFDLAA